MRVVPFVAVAFLLAACTAPGDSSDAGAGCATRAAHELRQLDRQIAQIEVASRSAMMLDLYGYGTESTYHCAYRGSGSVVCNKASATDHASRSTLDALVARQQTVMAQMYSCQRGTSG
jgi:hypothetical protein